MFRGWLRVKHGSQGDNRDYNFYTPVSSHQVTCLVKTISIYRLYLGGSMGSRADDSLRVRLPSRQLVSDEIVTQP
jgi:hypothetical protein